MTENAWREIGTAPDDFNRPGGSRTWRLRDRDGRETTGRRNLFNNSGWVESKTNRELWPTHWAPLLPVDPMAGLREAAGLAPDETFAEKFTLASIKRNPPHG